jgi:hypothetical protein
MFKPGDIIAFSGASLVSDEINIATLGLPRWSISHVGIIGEARDGRILLYEATTLDGLPCEITGQRINGTQAHSPDRVLAAYRGRAWQYSLYRELYPAERERLTEFLNDHIGVPYDEIGAFRAAGVGFSWIESLIHRFNPGTLFCSEYAAAGLSDIGIMPTTAPQRWNPNHLVRYLRRREILQEPMRLK